MNRPISANDAKNLSDTIQYLRYKVSPEDLKDLRELLPLLLHDNPQEVVAAHYAFIELLVRPEGRIVPMSQTLRSQLSAKESADDTIEKTSMADNK